MEIKIVDNNFSPEQWNEKAIHPLQSWEWGEARKALNVDIVRVGEFSREKLLNCYQFSLHPLPRSRYKVGYLPRSKFPNEKVLDFLNSYAKRNKIIFIKIEPYEEESPKFSNSRYLVKSPHSLFPEWTQILDIKELEENLLKKMKSKTRYNVRLAQKKGVRIVEKTNDEGFKAFINLYFETTRRQKYFGHNLEYHQKIFDALKNKLAYILIAEYEEIPVAAYEILIFKKIAYYIYGGTSLEHRNTMAANLLMWESIRFAKTKGADFFDMWGSLPPNYKNDHPWAGFTKFKEGYGGHFIKLAGSFDLVSRPVLYRIYNIIQRLRENYLNLKASIR